MKAILILLLTAAISCQTFSKEYISSLQRKYSSFKIAGYENHPFKDRTYEEIRQTLGSIRRENTHKHIPKGQMKNGVPDNFDAREQWPECIGKIRHQGNCGSCWAFGAAEPFGDRVCITENTKTKVELSTQALVSCHDDHFGCYGGLLAQTWEYLAHFGIPTEECYSYKSADGSVPACPDPYRHKVDICDDNSEPVYYRVSNVVHPQTIADIKAEIFENGPMEADLIVYEDFYYYESGIYRHQWGKDIGCHAIKVVGWGVENGENFWIAFNSWGTDWGEKGIFRIFEGECEFESNFYAGAPIKTSTYTRLNFLE